jgi:phage baseplate assembly protein W
VLNTSLTDLEVNRIGKGINLLGVFSEITGKISLNEGSARVNQSLEIISSTARGEVAMLPAIGSGLETLLFEPSDPTLTRSIELFLTESFNNLEPRIGIQNIDVMPYENNVFVKVNYYLKGSNIAGSFDYTITKQARGDVY